ncbi:hypothetical protein MMC28_006105 [Mycoblastus sanguinarius]|nr:hypothetical protein [Mycoblastus sanguinarius]
MCAEIGKSATGLLGWSGRGGNESLFPVKSTIVDNNKNRITMPTESFSSSEKTDKGSIKDLKNDLGTQLENTAQPELSEPQEKDEIEKIDGIQAVQMPESGLDKPRKS